MLNHYYTLKNLLNEFDKLVGSKIVECFTQENDSASFAFFDSEEYLFLKFFGIPKIEGIFLSEKLGRKKTNTTDIFHEILDEIVQEIELIEKSRILKFHLIHFDLYFILFGGGNNNILLTNKKGKIVNSLNSSKELIGSEFIIPTPNYFNFDDLPKDLTILKALSNSEFLLGKNYAEQILTEIGFDKQNLIKDISSNDLLAIKQRTEFLVAKLEQSSTALILSKERTENPQEFIRNSKNEVLFSLLPLKEFPNQLFESENISALIQRVLISRIRKSKFVELYKKYLNFAQIEYKRAKKQYGNLEAGKIKVELVEKYKLFGELLYSYSNLKEKGLKSVKIQDYSGNEYEIELNPKFTVIENAEKYFQKFKNLKKSLKISQERSSNLENDFKFSENLLENLQKAKNTDDLKIHFHNFEKFYKSKMSKEEKEISERFKTFVLSDEATLYVGKDAKNNDELTFGFGKPNDFWFHLRGGSGSHCILKFSGKGNPPKDIIEKAAEISAYFSSQRNGGFVPVAYTQRKYVRKPKGANPGAVVIAKEEVILVEPKI